MINLSPFFIITIKSFYCRNLPSWLFFMQMMPCPDKTIDLNYRIIKDLSFLSFGWNILSIGISAQVPSAFHLHAWKGHSMVSPFTHPPSPKCAPKCGQNASNTVGVPPLSPEGNHLFFTKF